MSFKLKFIHDESVKETEVIIKAKAQTEEVNKILELLGGEKLSCHLLSDKQLIDMNDIVILSKSGRFISIKTINGEFVLSEPLYQIEPKLNPTWFVKISQSEIVNLRYVKQWSFEGGGTIKIEMINGIRSYTSRRYTKAIREILRGGKPLK
ncbi:MAG TPA: LytTR family DNA-binding domain-containing protein [Bacilli bacterium]|nr:MAG: putative HTH-type transcriptional regulator [Tenericutes bacterium ADurb.BinA124]HPX84511.1 LytTR family DNA-binding domain-containing protein [Bacilli bacterium]HQC74863.1 LytTR family DNA-binding domain-containing protein [Bacilli bacterium]